MKVAIEPTEGKVTTDLCPIGRVSLDGEVWRTLALDGRRNPLVLDPSGGLVDTLSRETAGPAIYAALDEACTRLWGHSWNSIIGETFRLNRRTVQRDRVTKNLLPPRVFRIIGFIAKSPDAELLAPAIIAFSKYWYAYGDENQVRNYWDGIADLFLDYYDPHLFDLQRKAPRRRKKVVDPENRW